MAQQLRQADLAERLTSDLGQKVTQANVSQWVNGDHEPPRRMVFAIERCLDLKPGALSRVLGYLPVNARAVTTVEDALAADPRLSPEAQSLLRATYREAARRGPPS